MNPSDIVKDMLGPNLIVFHEWKQSDGLSELLISHKQHDPLSFPNHIKYPKWLGIGYESYNLIVRHIGAVSWIVEGIYLKPITIINLNDQDSLMQLKQCLEWLDELMDPEEIERCETMKQE